ncbi:alpha/beta fold hydrolase [Thermosipho sp. 1074]|uniref:alpha/beta fold hydrolase n=1 Tax=Thermosipho sp. 1074 TaxID=1643331 RepID=UPI0009849DB6|nr:alpha/beta hydrolase [Thermosipho sp. 1074]OOC44896.1 alpha/beta hydrolase [Thermosipho sp. 1074]
MIHYEIIPKGKKNILFLHGWGADFSYFKPIAEKLEYTSILVDLPGFGKSSKPPFVMSSFDYANTIENFIESLNLDSISLIGHSFGGKIAAILASKNPKWLDKLVIISAPGIRRKNLKLRCKVLTYKLLVKVFKFLNLNTQYLRERFGSEDFKNSQGIMREILKVVVNEDISEELKKIKSETLIIWGDLDNAVSFDVVKEFERLIQNSKLIIYKNVSHFPFLENYDRFLNDLKIFLGG